MRQASPLAVLGKYAAAVTFHGNTPEPVGERAEAGSGPVTPLALGVGADRTQEVHAAEVGPVGLAEVKF